MSDIEPGCIPIPIVSHCAQRTGIHRRNGRLHSRTRRKCLAGISGTILRLNKDRVGAVGGGLHNYVIGLGDADAELVDHDRNDLIAVGLNDAHLQAVDTHIEDAHRRAVNEAQPHPFTGPK
jgi:hypothetical protein